MTTKDLWTTQPLCKERRLIRQLVYEGFKPGSVNPYDLRHIWAKSFCTNCDSYKPFDGRPVDILNDETRGGIYAVKAAYEEGREKVVLMREVFEAGDFDRYIIEAHGLKNAAKQIGADELSELAKASELDGKAGNIDAVKARHEELLTMYEEVVDILSELF